MKINDNSKLQHGKKDVNRGEAVTRDKCIYLLITFQIYTQTFLIKLEQQMNDFKSHMKRVAKQYEEIKILKQNLARHEMLNQLDFAENYSCGSMGKVQSAYFNQTSVTLHPVVAYFRVQTTHLNSRA